MEPFFAKMGHNAICYDISNIMMTVMMVAGNSYVENKFRERNSSLLFGMIKYDFLFPFFMQSSDFCMISRNLTRKYDIGSDCFGAQGLHLR